MIHVWTCSGDLVWLTGHMCSSLWSWTDLSVPNGIFIIIIISHERKHNTQKGNMFSDRFIQSKIWSSIIKVMNMPLTLLHHMLNRSLIDVHSNRNIINATLMTLIQDFFLIQSENMSYINIKYRYCVLILIIKKTLYIL